MALCGGLHCDAGNFRDRRTLSLPQASNFNATDVLINAVNSSVTGSLNAATNSSLNSCYTNVTTDQRAFLCGADPNCYLSYKWNNNMKYAFIYHFFGLLWTNQVIIGFTYVTIAGAIAQYYW